MKISSLALLLLLFTKCVMDFFCDSTIHNLSGKSVEVIVFYNKHNLDSATVASNSTPERYYLKLQGMGVQNGIYCKTDTLKLSNTFILLNNKSLSVNHVVGGRTVEPDYTIIEKISIRIDKDSMVYYRKDLPPLFKKVERGLWTHAITPDYFKE